MTALWMVLLPLLAAAALFLLPSPLLHRPVAVVGVLGTLLLGYLAGADAVVSLPWIPALGAHFALDAGGAGGLLTGVAALVMLPTVLWAGATVERAPHRFLAWLLATLAGLAGIFMAKDLVLFYLFWELTLIPGLALLGGWGLAKRREALQKYLMYAIAGSFLMLLGLLALRPLSGADGYLFEQLAAATPLMDVRSQAWIFACFAIAFAVKLPIFPLHAWLADVHQQNHPSGAADVAGTLYKVGGFGLFAWAIPLLPAGAAVLAPAGLALGALTAVYGALIALRQSDLKRLLAYASLSHMGIVAVGLFSLQPAGHAGAMGLLAAQMVTTGGLFLVSGMLHRRSGSFELAAYGGLARSAPALAACSLLLVFASVGVPGLANFPGEFLSLLGAFRASTAAAVLAVLAVIASGALGVFLYQRLFQGESHGAAVHEIRPLEVAVLAPLLAMTLALGLAPARGLATFEAEAMTGPSPVIVGEVLR